VLGFLIAVEAVKRMFYAYLATSLSPREGLQGLTRRDLPYPSTSIAR